MTADEIAARLVDAGKPISPERVRKLRKLCDRMDVQLSDVLALLSDKQQQAVANAS